MRVTGGALRGRRLRAPRSGARPTSDRVREALFSRLDVSGAEVLDLYAGSGALGIEAISRGARRAVFVDDAAASLAALRANLASLDLGGRSRVVAADAARALRRLGRAGERFDLVLLDPPYASEEAERALRALVEAGLLRDAGLVVVEGSRRHPVPVVAGLQRIDERSYGGTRLALLERAGARAPRPRDPESPTEERQRMPRDARQPTVTLFPASFDPVTNGHLDIVSRSLKIFDRVIVAVAVNVAKTGTFSVEERLEALEVVLGSEPRVEITSFDGLTTEFARSRGADAVIRGVRAMSDFEYEFEMALMNKHLNPELETIFMMPSQEYLYVSSSRLKELVRFGRPVDEFVPAVVAKKLREKLVKP